MYFLLLRRRRHDWSRGWRLRHRTLSFSARPVLRRRRCVASQPAAWLSITTHVSFSQTSFTWPTARTTAFAAFCWPRSGWVLWPAQVCTHNLPLYHRQRRYITLRAGQRGYERKGGGRALEWSLSNPWDVASHGHVLYIAMAGTHQIWMYNEQSTPQQDYE